MEVQRAEAPSLDANTQIDALLLPFVQARDDVLAASLRNQLILDHADKIIKGIIGRELRVSFKSSASGQDAVDAHGAEEIYGEAIVQILEGLDNLWADPQQNPIRSFRGYISVTTYHEVDDYLRRKHRQRNSLKNKIRYLLRNQRGFALWESAENLWLCGYEKWRHDEKTLTRNRPYQQLLDEPQKFAQEKFPQTDLQRLPLAELVHALFLWTDGPIVLNDIVNILAQLLGIKDQLTQTDNPDTEEDEDSCIINVLTDSTPSVAAKLEEGQLLKHLWNEICVLPRVHRVALLLNLKGAEGHSAIELFPLSGIVSIKQIAIVLELTYEELARLWHKLPMSDLEIAEILGCKRQDVINLRKTARRRLGRCRAVFG